MLKIVIASAAGDIASLSQYIQSKDDAVSEVFVRSGFKLLETMQEFPPVYNCLNALHQECGFNNPLNSIHKINFCIKAGETRPEAMTWLFEAILDGTRSQSKYVTESTLQQFRNGRGGNLPWIIIQKQEFKHFLMSRIAGMFSLETTTTLKEIFHDHESYRRGWKNIDDVMQPSKFLQSWSAAERLVADFISAACFNNDEAYNAAYLTSIRHRRSTEELLSHSIFHDNWENICSLHKEQ